MKNILAIAITFIVLISPSSFANDISVINGSTELNNSKYLSLRVNGSLKFEDLVVENSLVVNGAIHGENLTCNTIKANGSANINKLQSQNLFINGSFLGNNIDVKGDSKFNGTIDIKNSKLQNIKINSTNSTITGTHINGNINIKKNTNSFALYQRFFYAIIFFVLLLEFLVDDESRMMMK
jgi:cytoskeletal protein CcmA (bactofilin family)